jgi:hypothetical protein
MKQKCALAVIVSLLALTTLSAQRSKTFNSSDYVTALGVKLYPGSGGAVTFKHFIKPTIALEALASFWNRGTRATGLYEFHFDIASAPGLKWYVGPGAHVSLYNGRNYVSNNTYLGGSSYAAIGIDGVIGLDYKFSRIPLDLSADWQPAFEFGSNHYNGFGGDFGGISARYTF